VLIQAFQGGEIRLPPKPIVGVARQVDDSDVRARFLGSLLKQGEQGTCEGKVTSGIAELLFDAILAQLIWCHSLSDTPRNEKKRGGKTELLGNNRLGWLHSPMVVRFKLQIINRGRLRLFQRC